MRVYDSSIHALFYYMSKQKKFSWQNLLFIAILLLLLIPQTRTPIQVALNKVKVALFSPSAFAKADQQQLKPFTYRLTSLDGTSQNVSIGTGRVIFISYWATWCPPCIAELPSIENLYKDYGDRVDFLLITNEEAPVVAKFMSKKGYSLPAVLPAMQTPEQLFERSIPTTYIIDKTGRIIIKEKGASNWNSNTVRATLDELIAQ